MARARNIKPAFFKNELLGQADPLLSLLFASLWTLADRQGRLEDRPLRIKAETFPYRDVPLFNGYLTQLEQHGFIDRYTVGDLAIIQIVNFRKHQAPHNTEKASELPERPIDMPITVKQPLKTEKLTQAKRPDSLIPDSLNTDSLIPYKKPSAAFALPDWINQADWDLWMQTRKGKKMGLDQMQAQVNKLSGWRDVGIDYAQALKDSAAAGWAGLFQPKNHNTVNRVQEARLNVAQQIMGGKHGTKGQIIDITPRSAIEGNGASIPKAPTGIRESDAG